MAWRVFRSSGLLASNHGMRRLLVDSSWIIHSMIRLPTENKHPVLLACAWWISFHCFGLHRVHSSQPSDENFLVDAVGKLVWHTTGIISPEKKTHPSAACPVRHPPSTQEQTHLPSPIHSSQTYTLIRNSQHSSILRSLRKLDEFFNRWQEHFARNGREIMLIIRTHYIHQSHSALLRRCCGSLYAKNRNEPMSLVIHR